MKAKFGKLSIWCVIASIVLVCIAKLCEKYFADTFRMLPATLFLLPIMVLIFAGIIFGFVSALKQEEPKRYRYVGFLLNLLLILIGLFLPALG